MRFKRKIIDELVDLKCEQANICDGSRMQGRNYGDEGKRVRDKTQHIVQSLKKTTSASGA